MASSIDFEEPGEFFALPGVEALVMGDLAEDFLGDADGLFSVAEVGVFLPLGLFAYHEAMLRLTGDLEGEYYLRLSTTLFSIR